jgi:hypothetical protein
VALAHDWCDFPPFLDYNPIFSLDHDELHVPNERKKQLKYVVEYERESEGEMA